MLLQYPPDIQMLILSRCGNIRTISRLAQTCKALQFFIMHSPNGHSIWLDMASNLTGYNTNELANAIDYHARDFHESLKCIACPWLVVPQPLTVKVEPTIEPENMRITLVNEGRHIALWLKEEDSSTGDRFRAMSIEKSRPSTGAQSLALDDECGRENVVLQRPRAVSDNWFYPIAQPVQLQILTSSSDSRYFYQKIHRNVFAIIEMAAWDMEHRSGIYFFNKRTGRLLRHIVIGVCPAPTNMIVRPMEMWMLTEEKVIYFGPTGDRLHLTAQGRMDWPMWLVGNGRAKKAMKTLQRLGITDINAPSITGNMTLLHAATLHDQIDAARELLAAKADPECRDDRDMSCVMLAASVGNFNMIRLLCAEGSALPNATTGFSESALHVAGLKCNDHVATREAVRALLDCMADPNTEDGKGRTPLFSYAIINDMSTARLLCFRGGDPTHKDHRGRTPLHAMFASFSQRWSATVLVQEFGADVNAVDKDGITPLMLAAKMRTFVNVKILLEDLNANPLLTDHKGHDALWFANNGRETPAQAHAVIRLIEAKCEEWAKAPRR